MSLVPVEKAAEPDLRTPGASCLILDIAGISNHPVYDLLGDDVLHTTGSAIGNFMVQQ